jgi:hypothetical protein
MIGVMHTAFWPRLRSRRNDNIKMNLREVIGWCALDSSGTGRKQLWAVINMVMKIMVS